MTTSANPMSAKGTVLLGRWLNAYTPLRSEVASPRSSAHAGHPRRMNDLVLHQRADACLRDVQGRIDVKDALGFLPGDHMPKETCQE